MPVTPLRWKCLVALGTWALLSPTAHPEETPAAIDPPFAARLQPVARESGFKQPGYWVWCGSPIMADGEFHLFASRWPKAPHSLFPEGYRDYSEIVRASSPRAEGPYTFQEVVIGRRDGGFWDSHMAHNPTVHKIGATFVLFYIGSDGATLQTGSRSLQRFLGYATAPSVRGPWTRSARAVVAGDANNPALCVDTDGSVKLMYRDAALKVLVATAPAYDGPYTVKNADVFPGRRLEDFYLFKVGGQYHMICEDNVGAFSGHERWGVHFISADGVSDWRPAAPVIAYDHDIALADGQSLHSVRRERPQLLIDDGKITHLVTAIYDGHDSWSQPVPLLPALPLSP
jgi:hypothetical protein